MPRYNADPTSVAAGFPVFPKDDYELLVKSGKAFQRDGQNGTNFGVRFLCSVESDGQYKGAKFTKNCYWHTEESKPMSKQFVMACLGYNPRDREDEKRFDSDFRGKDWGFDTDTGEVGDMWHQVIGQRVIASLDVGQRKDNGDEQQQEKGYRPLGAA